MDSAFPINQIMQRYQLHAGNNLLYSYEELRRMDIDQQFIYTLLQIFEDEKTFSEAEFEKYSLEIIIDYIQRTHNYYLSKKLPEIEQSINILLKDYSNHHPLLTILNSFFIDYAAHLTAHIRAEEKQLLPYIKNLLKIENTETDLQQYFNTTGNYSLQSFIESHQDTEKNLSEVRNAILEYQPPITNQTPYRILLTQLQAFEKDLYVHAVIEDKVLIPRVMQLEEKLRKKFIGN
jgi:regulator of cell morphogenesis and NO signaling